MLGRSISALEIDAVMGHASWNFARNEPGMMPRASYWVSSLGEPVLRRGC